MNSIVQKFFSPSRKGPKSAAYTALFGLVLAGAILIGGSVLGSGSMVPTALAHSCTGNTSSSPCATVASISVTQTVDNDTLNEGDIVHMTLTVTNSGPATSTDVVVNDPAEWGLTFTNVSASQGTYSNSTGKWTIGTLSSGQSVTLVVTAQVNSGIAGTTGVDVHNDATVKESSSETDPNTADNTASVTICVNPCPPTTVTSTTPSADISISKTADVTSTFSGDTVHYTVTVTDNGPATSTGVVATDTLPAGMTFVSATASEGSYSSSTGGWNVGTLSNGQSATLTITATANTVTASTTVTNTATVSESASETDPNTANNSSSVSICVEPCPTTVTPTADISIVKTVDNANPAVGDTVNYTLTVTDLGPATSTGVTATDILPSGVTFVNATASVGTYASSTGTWTIGDLGASSNAVLDIAATVDSGTAGNTITNVGTVSETASTTDNNLGNNSSSVAIVVQGGGCTSNCGGGGAVDADIAIAKTADVTSTTEGGTINYTITATDLGPSASTDVVATDTLPSGLTFVSATPSTGSYASSTGTWTIGTLNANATATLAIQATVNTGTAGTTITNTATIGESTTETDTNTSNDTATVSIPVQSNGGGGSGTDDDMAVVKTVDNASPTAGTTINFTVTVTDNGPAAGTMIYVMDQLPPGLGFVSATTSQGGYDLTTGEWNIGAVAPNATATMTIAAMVGGSTPVGTVFTNTAVVSSTLASLVDSNPANNSSTVTVTVASAGCTSNCGGGGGSTQSNIGIVKTVDDSTPATGATIHYTLTVSDTGPSASFGVVASDLLPAGVTFVSASSTDGSYNSATGVWTIGALNNGQNVTLVITATVNAAAGTTITNTGTVSENPGIINTTPGNTSSSVSITVAGGGGGGGGGTVTVPSGGGGGGGGQVLGASTSTGQVLGASCGLYLDQYIHPIRKDLNDPTEVKKLQVFLNQNLGLNIPVTGYYGDETIAAVNQFQVKYHIEVLAPWVPLGLPTQFTPTSYVYQSTQRWINLIMCPPLNLPLPALKVDTGE